MPANDIAPDGSPVAFYRLADGADAYEGLSAFVVWSFPGDGTFHGHITAEGPPSTPELPVE